MIGTAAMVQDEIIFYGHPNVQSVHTKTIEITKDEHLTLRGDCIIGVLASKGCADLDETLKYRLKSDSAIVKMEVMVGKESFQITGTGDQRLQLSHRHDIVLRRTEFVCSRTISVRCDKASSEIPREIVRMLQDKRTRAIFRVTVE
jgi:uncharacterized protein